MIDRIADRLVLRPTTHPIDPEERERRVIPIMLGEIEAWLTRSVGSTKSPDWVAIKFPGTGGRAERGGPHPFELRQDRSTEIWTINHSGYGGSSGNASLKKMAATCDAVWDHVRQLYAEIPIALVGNSLGCLSALYLAARKNPRGVFLRNPVALRQMIASRPRYNWWNFGLARLIANQIPAELDAVENAKQSQCPLFLIRSEHDRVSPTRFQRLIFESYLGRKSEYVIRGADHHDSISESEAENYQTLVKQWMQQL